MNFMRASSLKQSNENLNLKVEIVRETDPRCTELEASGYTLVGQSWGARLRLDEKLDLSSFNEAVHGLSTTGIEIHELGVEFAAELLALELINNADYPYTPATFHAIPTLESIRALWNAANKVFGAFDDEKLVGAISTSRASEIVELDFASVLSNYRGKGIGKAMVAAAIVDWAGQGVAVFATGGAAVNAASLGTVQSLGFSIEERWRSYQPPL